MATTASIEIAKSMTPIDDSPTTKLEAACLNLQTCVDELKSDNKRHWNETYRNERTLLDVKSNVHDGFWGGVFIVVLLLLLTVGVLFLQRDVSLQSDQYKVVRQSIDSTVSIAVVKAMKAATEPVVQASGCANVDDLPSIACPSGPKLPVVKLDAVTALRRVAFQFQEKSLSITRSLQQMDNKPEHESSVVALKDELFVLQTAINVAKAFSTYLDGNPNHPNVRFSLGNNRNKGWVTRYATYQHLHHAMIKYDVLVGIEVDQHGEMSIYCH